MAGLLYGILWNVENIHYLVVKFMGSSYVCICSNEKKSYNVCKMTYVCTISNEDIF